VNTASLPRFASISVPLPEMAARMPPSLARKDACRYAEAFGADQMSNPNLPRFMSVQPDGVSLAIKLQPRASANEIGEPLGNELRVKVTAPPVDAAANEALIRLLADQLDCPRGRVELVRGHTSRHKVVKVHGLAAEAVLKHLPVK
jgi:hypothetical protein